MLCTARDNPEAQSHNDRVASLCILSLQLAVEGRVLDTIIWKEADIPPATYLVKFGKRLEHCRMFRADYCHAQIS
jgi:hypothetical protein